MTKKRNNLHTFRFQRRTNDIKKFTVTNKKIEKMNLQNAQLEVDNWIKNHGVRYFNELTNMAQLSEEVGEVARIIARRYGEQTEKESDKNKDLGEELADVVFVVLCLANQTGINLQEAFDKKLDVKTNRDHDRHQNNDKLK
jgi:NTP pyrophosphatase (non-canonical NTP hydrolase)